MDLDTNRSLIAAALARIPGGDRAALQTVYRLTSAKLFGVALRILGERSEAEDVLQEVYVTVWRMADDAPGAEAALEGAEEHARLHGCLGELAAREQAALRGAFFDGNTYEDLAERMKVPLGTMKSWIRRAMIKLKACLER